MKCGHLFNGIGGFALAAHWMGWENLMHCEIDPFGNKVMNYHFPNSYKHEDIRKTDFTIWRNESLKALGNAIVPQVAYQIFKAIEQYEKLL